MNIRPFWRNWGSWGIAVRLLAIAVLPAAVMFVAVTVALYVISQGDVRRDVAERGRLIATALAQSSQYGLVSGNAGYLRTTLHNLREADASIACIDIINGQRKPVVSDCLQGQAQASADHAYEVPVHIESLPEVDLFEPAAPPATAAQEPRRAEPAGHLRIVGYVRVSMSPAPILQAKRRAWLAASGLVLVAAVLSCWVGLRLARRLRDTLLQVMSALRTIRQGRFGVQLNIDHQGELGELQRTIMAMAGTLQAARDELEQKVALRTQELQEAVDLVKEADAEKRRLIVHSNALVEEDRRRVALEIHDHLCAALISVRLEAAALAAKAEALGDADMLRGAKRIAETTEALYANSRNIVKSLRPELIDTLGLSGALEELVRSYDKIHPACRFAFNVDPALPDLRGEQAIPAYRVTQEALTNIVKHSGATQASVGLALTPSRQHLRIVIDDNGRGFDTRQSKRAGLGLIGMRERVAAAGGEIDFQSAPGQGSRVVVTLPLKPRLAADGSGDRSGDNPG